MNGVLAKWYPTLGKTYDSPKGDTAGIWKLYNDSSKWLSPTFGIYSNTSGMEGVARNGYLYSFCSTGTWLSGCPYGGSRLGNNSLIAPNSSNGIPSCNGATWTNTVQNYGGAGAVYYWNNSSIGYAWGNYNYFIRCYR